MRSSEVRAALEAIEAECGDIEVEIETDLPEPGWGGAPQSVYAARGINGGPKLAIVSTAPPSRR